MGCGLVLTVLFILAHFAFVTSLSPLDRIMAAGMGIIMLIGGYYQYALAKRR